MSDSGSSQAVERIKNSFEEFDEHFSVDDPSHVHGDGSKHHVQSYGQYGHR